VACAEAAVRRAGRLRTVVVTLIAEGSLVRGAVPQPAVLRLRDVELLRLRGCKMAQRSWNYWRDGSDDVWHPP
jgi:hypothetical protein